MHRKVQLIVCRGNLPKLGCALAIETLWLMIGKLRRPI